MRRKVRKIKLYDFANFFEESFYIAIVLEET